MVVISSITVDDRSVDLQQMRYVVALAERRSFTRAAEHCHVVQSALSQQVARLEDELGVRLFARTSRRVEVTPAGEAFVARARECLAAAEMAGFEAAAAEGEVRGRVAIGVIPTVTSIDLPATMVAFRTRYPEVRIALRTGSSDELAGAVAGGELDAAVLGLPHGEAPAGVAGRELVHDRHVAVLWPGHPLAGRSRLRLRQLVDEPFVDFPERSPARRQSDLAFAAAGLPRRVPFEVDALLILDLVRAGLAVALLPARFVTGEAGVVTVPVTDGPTRVEHLVWNDFNPSPAARAFLETVR
jgi:DNA-binding transcriptional LysR family regulator